MILALSIDTKAPDNHEARGFRATTLDEKAKELQLAASLWSGKAHSFRYCRLLDGVSGDRLQQRGYGRHNEALCSGLAFSPRIWVAIASLLPQTMSQGDWGYGGAVAKRQVSWGRNSRSEQKGRVYMIIISQSKAPERAASRG